MLDVVGKARLGGRQFFQRHIFLVVQFAQPVADAAPSGVFGQRALDLVIPELADQSHEQAIELLVGDGESRLTADQQARGGAGREAIEIGIGQDRDPLLGHFQKARLDGGKGRGLNRLAAKKAAARIPVPDPLDVLLDGEPAVRDPAQPVLSSLAP